MNENELMEKYLEKMRKMELAKTILKNHGYNYSKIYQKFSRGRFRIQFDLKKDIDDLDPSERGMLLATKLLLKNYEIDAYVEITDANGDARILFDSDYEKMRNSDVVI